MLTFSEIKKNTDINTYILKADEALAALGFTNHSFGHVEKVANTAKYILTKLNYPEREIELVQIAAYLHDIGNLANRIGHAQIGAVMAFQILNNLGFQAEEVATIVSAIGNHDEGASVAVNAVAAALILADKTDVRYTRVRNRDIATFDIHDRVNYAVKESTVSISDDNKDIELKLIIDTNQCTVMDYFEIFLNRMILCRKAAEFFGMRFKLTINNQSLL